MRAALDKKRFGPWALVTGASSGIGKEFARQIAASGINIVLVARREDLLKEVGVEFSKRYGVEHRVVVFDVSREDFIGQLASATDDLDIGLVVSNAGTGNPGEFLKLDRQLLQATLRLSTMAQLHSWRISQFLIGTSLPILFVGHLKQGRNCLSWRPDFAIHASISRTV